MTDTPAGSGAMQVDFDLVKRLAGLIEDSRLSEIEVQDGERRIRVVGAPSGGWTVYAPPSAAPVAPPPPLAGTPAPSTAAANPAAPPPAPADHPGTIKSPMVGTVYLAADPAAKPFAAVGDTVEAGATLLIVEAMKVMNAIASPRAGKVTAVLVANGQPVEFDQPLVILE